jgi:GTP-binding protein
MKPAHHPSLPRFIKSVVDVELLPTDRPHIALFGRSNVGKSTLLNTLTKIKISKTSSTPGRTQMVNMFEMEPKWYLVDMPGYGYAKASKDTRQKLEDLILAYLNASPPLALVCLIIDARRGEPTDLDREMIEGLNEHGFPFVLVLNKIDTLTRQEIQTMMTKLSQEFQPAQLIPFSSKTNVGREALLHAIHQSLRSHQKSS